MVMLAFIARGLDPVMLLIAATGLLTPAWLINRAFPHEGAAG
jgi:hypothetical protein